MARLAGAIRKRNSLPGPIAFAYQLRKSDGCNLLKTKLEFASSSKADCPLGRAIRKRNSLPGRIAFAYQLRKSDGCNLLKTKLEFASSSKAFLSTTVLPAPSASSELHMMLSNT